MFWDGQHEHFPDNCKSDAIRHLCNVHPDDRWIFANDSDADPKSIGIDRFAALSCFPDSRLPSNEHKHGSPHRGNIHKLYLFRSIGQIDLDHYSDSDSDGPDQFKLPWTAFWWKWKILRSWSWGASIIANPPKSFKYLSRSLFPHAVNIYSTHHRGNTWIGVYRCSLTADKGS